ncbi:hypothetical protein BGAL_0484g00020 [Botrytis galanthina]|uniref:AAA+ ATPase domain-containing protein n=1 Tax=Botrytis galanthina TaxID=278940 RepID=A0A4S8QP73_9HELO|nr:hypothetical protein BGAL_0484g00020 [Botrytis galanthina]
MADITCVTIPEINNFGVDTTKALHGTQVQERALDEKVEDASENDDREEKPRANVGDEESVPDIKHLYQEEGRHPWNISWTSTKPKTNVEEFGTIITVRRARNPENQDLWVLHSILIHSSQLKETLRSVLYGDVNILEGESDFVLEPPFESVFHSWLQMTTLNARTPTEDNGLAQFQMLYKVLFDNLDNVFKKIDVLLANQSITYDLLWAIFKHDDIISTVDSCDQVAALRALRCEYETDSNPHFLLGCEYVDTNGSAFGLVSTSCRIMPFKGTRKIDSLSCFPIRFLPSEMQKPLMSMLLDRGQRFAELVGRKFRHVTYDGLEFTPSEEENTKDRKLRKTKGRIIIDPEAFDDHNWEEAPRVRVFPTDSDDTPKKLSHGDEFMLCKSTVRGYSLSSKSWATFLIGGIKKIEWNESCASKLMLPNGYKELLSSLVEQQMRADDGFDDFIKQKGQGLIILLGGNPGVGKTLTSEILAEEHHAPLYVVSAGQLGYDPSRFEERMKLVLELAARWKAILLLDEGDIFLEKRSTSDLARNRLVSSVLFITTNRGAVIDEAIRSRIHIQIQVPDLDRDTRRSLWKSFLEQNKIEHALRVEDFEELADIVMNGREIKNSIKSSVLMARKKGSLPLDMKHIRFTVDLLDAFKNGT